jgi:hypothetical protein
MNSRNIAELTATELAEIFDESPYYPMAVVGDSLYTLDTNEDGETSFVWVSVRIEVVTYYNLEGTGEKLLRIRAIPQGFEDDEEQLLSTEILERRYISAINRYGWVYSEKHQMELISYLQASAANAPHVTRYGSIGWTEIQGKPAFRTDKILLRGKSKALNAKFEYAGATDLSSSVEVDDYISTLNSLLTTGGAMFAIVAGLSSALLAMLSGSTNIGSLMLHIFGDSSKGKTTFLRVACSCWGNPSKSPLVNTWNSTPTAFYSTLANNFGVAVGFDEASSSCTDFTNLIYTLTSGADRAKCNKDSTLKEQKRWNTTIISTAEESLLGHSKQNKGLKVRCLEFFDLEVTKDSAHAEQLGTFVQNNYGILGEMFVRFLLKRGLDKAKYDYENCRSQLSEHIQQRCGLTDRLVNTYAILYSTARYAAKIGIAVDVKSVVKILLSHHKSTLEDLNSSGNLYNAILEYIVLHGGKFHKLDNKMDYFDCEGVYDSKYYYILDSTFSKILALNKYADKKVALKQLIAEDVLERGKDRYYIRKTISGKKVNCYKIVKAKDSLLGKAGE